MGKKRSSNAAASDESVDAIERLDESVNRLADEMQSLWQTLDAIRDTLSWITRNGVPPHADSPVCHGVLKRMALDPTAEDWGERLDIDFGDQELDDAQMMERPGDETCKDGPHVSSPPNRGDGKLF